MRIRKIKNAEQLIQSGTFGEVLGKFLRQCEVRNLSKETIGNYKQVLFGFMETMEVEHINELGPQLVDDYIEGYMETHPDTRPVTINSRLRSVQAFANFCSQRGYIEPFTIKMLKTEETIKETYTEEEIARLIRKPCSDNWCEWRSWAMVNYMLATGNRLRTVTALRIRDVNMMENRIFLSEMKNRRQQLIPLSSALKTVLKTYLATWYHDDDDFLFPSSTGGRMSKYSVQGAIARYNRQRHVDKTSCHLFRHTFAKMYIMNGGGVPQLQLLLGHSTLDMTMNYVKMFGTDLAKDFDKLNPLDQFVKFNR